MEGEGGDKAEADSTLLVVEQHQHHQRKANGEKRKRNSKESAAIRRLECLFYNYIDLNISVNYFNLSLQYK